MRGESEEGSHAQRKSIGSKRDLIKDEKEQKLCLDSEVEKAELEKTTTERRASVKLDTDTRTNGSSSKTNGLVTTTEGEAQESTGNTTMTATVTGTTRTAAATMQRENSLKRKLILAFSSTKSALRPACIFGPRRKQSI